MSLWPFRKPALAPVAGPARHEDAASLASIHSGGFERGWDAAEFERLLTDRAVLAHVARQGGKGTPLGFILSRLAADEAEVLTIAVAAKMRGKGVARGLVSTHLGALAGRGIKALFLEVAEDNLPALKLYRRVGFTEVGRRKGYYARQGGAPATALIMKRPL